MHTRLFAILEHTTPDGGAHHDLLIDRPDLPDPLPAADEDAKTLWAVRIGPPPGDWLELGRLVLTPLPPHRRRYLTYEGPISRGRGDVRRLAGGDCEVQAEPGRTTVRLTIAGQRLTLTVAPDTQGRLVADVRPDPGRKTLG